jgi:hypothetical protein
LVPVGDRPAPQWRPRRHRHHRVRAGRAQWSWSVLWFRSSHWTSSHWTSSRWSLSRWTLSDSLSRWTLSDSLSRWSLSDSLSSEMLLSLCSSMFASWSSSATSHSADLSASSHRHSVGHSRCSRRCRSCRYPDSRRHRSCRCRWCRLFHWCSLQSHRCRRNRPSVPCLAPQSNAHRREGPKKTGVRQWPKPRPGHTGIGRRPRGRPTRRRARANPRRHHPPGHRRPAIKMIRRYSHSVGSTVLLCVLIYSSPGQPGAADDPDDSVGLHHHCYDMNRRRDDRRPQG